MQDMAKTAQHIQPTSNLMIAMLIGNDIEIKIVMPRYIKAREINVIFQFLEMVEDTAEITTNISTVVLSH
jgi:hypothetical protein